MFVRCAFQPRDNKWQISDCKNAMAVCVGGWRIVSTRQWPAAGWADCECEWSGPSAQDRLGRLPVDHCANHRNRCSGVHTVRVWNHLTRRPPDTLVTFSPTELLKIATKPRFQYLNFHVPHQCFPFAETSVGTVLADTRTRQQFQYTAHNTEYFTLPDPSQVPHKPYVTFQVFILSTWLHSIHCHFFYFRENLYLLGNWTGKKKMNIFLPFKQLTQWRI